jgi:hypothetical protein
VAVLVVTNEQDLAADYVVLELERRHVDVLRCNAERFPQWRVVVRPGQDWLLTDAHERTISCASTTGVWWRRPEPPVFDVDLSSGERNALVEQWQAFAEGLASVPGPRWVSPPAAIAAAEDKARQLATARTVGLRVPETVWTNDLARARSLATDDELVVKTVTAAHWEDDAEAAFVFAHALPAHDLPTDAVSFATAPTALQHKVHPKRDIRVTVAGASVIAAQTSSASLDWRTDSSAEWKAHALAEEVADKCRSLVAALGLQFGGVDLALDEHGEYWFLEVNPNGEWGWLQHAGLPIASALADLLTTTSA